MFLHVIEAKYIDSYKLWLKFNDNSDGKIDLSNQLEGEIFEPLKNINFFKNFKLEGHTLSWENGADFAPEFLKSLLIDKNNVNMNEGEGFYTDDFFYVNLIRDKYSDYQKLFAEVNKFALKIQYSINIKITDDNEKTAKELYSVKFFMSNLNTIQASIILLERGLIIQAQVLLRTSLEIIYRFGALVKNPKQILQDLDSNLSKEGKRFFKKIQNSQDISLKEYKNIEILEKGKPLQVKCLAIMADMEDSYNLTYQILSWSAHAQFWEINTIHHGKENLENEPHINDLEKAWIIAIENILISLRFLNEIFDNLFNREELDNFNSALRKLSNSLNQKLDNKK